LLASVVGICSDDNNRVLHIAASALVRHHRQNDDKRKKFNSLDDRFSGDGTGFGEFGFYSGDTELT